MWVVIHSSSHVWLVATPWTAAHQGSLTFTISRNLLKLMFIESVMPFNHLIVCRPFSPYPQSFPASGSFPMNCSFREVTKVLVLQLQHQCYQWIFRVDFLKDWLVWSPCCPRNSQKSSPASQIKSINSSALFMVQQSHLYVTALSAKWCLYFLMCCLGLSELFFQEANVF